MTDEPKRWSDTASNPIADIDAERERLKARDGYVVFRATPGERITFASPSPKPAPYVPGCRCGCSDGRRTP